MQIVPIGVSPLSGQQPTTPIGAPPSTPALASRDGGDSATISAAGREALAAEEQRAGKPDAGEQQEPTRAGQARDQSGEPLDESERRRLRELQRRDREVRQHEQAHVAAAGRFALGGASFQYEQGPDGRRYAVGGEVDIDVSEESEPEATIAKMQQVRRAALAPAEPSAADRAIAAQAARVLLEARQELAREQRAEASGEAPEAAARLDVRA